MKSNVTEYEFCSRFEELRPNNFSYEGRMALYDYLCNLEDDCGIEIELDVIALCCEFSEYENLEEFQSDYGSEYETIEDIENQTTVIMIDNDSFIIQDF